MKDYTKLQTNSLKHSSQVINDLSTSGLLHSFLKLRAQVYPHLFCPFLCPEADVTRVGMLLFDGTQRGTAIASGVVFHNIYTLVWLRRLFAKEKGCSGFCHTPDSYIRRWAYPYFPYHRISEGAIRSHVYWW